MDQHCYTSHISGEIVRPITRSHNVFNCLGRLGGTATLMPPLPCDDSDEEERLGLLQSGSLPRIVAPLMWHQKKAGGCL